MLKVRYDVGMAEILPAEGASIEKLTGRYIDISNNKNTAEFFKFEDRLWKANKAFGNKFEYVGNNTFEEVNNPSHLYRKLEFKLLLSGSIELTETYIVMDLTKQVVYLKERV